MDQFNTVPNFIFFWLQFSGSSCMAYEQKAFYVWLYPLIKSKKIIINMWSNRKKKIKNKIIKRWWNGKKNIKIARKIKRRNKKIPE